MSQPDFYDEVSKADKIISVEMSLDVQKLGRDGLLNDKIYTDSGFFRFVEKRMNESNANDFWQSVTLDNGVKIGIKVRRTKNGFKYRYFGIQKFIQRGEGIPFWGKIVMRIFALFPCSGRALLEEGVRRRIWEAMPILDKWIARKRASTEPAID